MKILTIGMDRNFLAKDADSKKRFIEYAKNLEELHLLIYTKKGFQVQKIADNIWMYPTNSSGKLTYILDALRIGRGIIDKRKIDSIITHDPVATGLAGWILARIYGLKLLVSVYGSNIFEPMWQKEWKNRLMFWIGKITLRSADAIQADSMETVDELVRRYGSKVFWKPLVPSYIGNYKIEKEINRETVNILFIARLAKQKNIPFLVEIADKISRRNEARVRFTLIGDGEEWDYLEGEIKRRGLSETVNLIRGCRQDELLFYYRQADIFILTSFYEGFPRVFMEAAAAGIPIITTRVSGATDIIDDGQSGYIIGQGDIDGFVRRLEQLAADKVLRGKFSQAIKLNFWAKYDYGLTVKKTEEIFKYLETAKR